MTLSIIIALFIISQGWFLYLFFKPLTPRPKRKPAALSPKNKFLEQHVSINEAEQNV